MPGVDIFKTHCLREFQKGDGHFFKISNFQNFIFHPFRMSFILSQTPPSDAEPASADRHLILLWAGCWDSAEMDPLELFIHPWWGVVSSLSISTRRIGCLSCLEVQRVFCKATDLTEVPVPVLHSGVNAGAGTSARLYLFPHPGWIAASSVNWTTKENRQKTNSFFFWSMEKAAWDGSKKDREVL